MTSVLRQLRPSKEALIADRAGKPRTPGQAASAKGAVQARHAAEIKDSVSPAY